jgi:hypothetical protein
VRTALSIGVKVFLQKVWKKDQLHDYKENEQLEQDNNPHRLSPGHAFKSITIKLYYPFRDVHLHKIYGHSTN